MTLPRLRYTIRRMLLAILAVALLLTGYVTNRNLMRRKAMIQQAWTELMTVDNALMSQQETAEATWRLYRSGYASRDEFRSQSERVDRLRDQEKAIQARLTHLRHGD